MLKELTTYTQAFNDLEELKRKNKAVWAEYDLLENKFLQAETELKTAVKIKQEDVKNKFFDVRFIRKFEKSYNPDKLMELAYEKEKLLLNEVIEIKKSVNKIKLTKLIEAEMIRPEVAQQAFEEKELPSAVLIKQIIN